MLHMSAYVYHDPKSELQHSFLGLECLSIKLLAVLEVRCTTIMQMLTTAILPTSFLPGSMLGTLSISSFCALAVGAFIATFLCFSSAPGVCPHSTCRSQPQSPPRACPISTSAALATKTSDQAATVSVAMLQGKTVMHASAACCSDYRRSAHAGLVVLVT